MGAKLAESTNARPMRYPKVWSHCESGLQQSFNFITRLIEMKKLLAPLVALAFGLASISAFAADEPAKDNMSGMKMDKADKKPAAKKGKRAAKKGSAAKAKKDTAPAGAPSK